MLYWRAPLYLSTFVTDVDGLHSKLSNQVEVSAILPPEGIAVST